MAWAFTTPAMLHGMSLGSRVSTRRVLWFLACDEAMLALGLAGFYAEGPTAAALLAASTLAFVPVARGMLEMLRGAVAELESLRVVESVRATRVAYLTTLALWCVFPAVCAAVLVDALRPLAAEAVYTAADVATKVVCASRLMSASQARAGASRGPPVVALAPEPAPSFLALSFLVR